MLSEDKKLLSPQKIIYPWTYPTLHKAKRWYVDFYILDPASNRMRRKKYMLTRYKTVKAKYEMARQKISWLVDEIKQGWNPFVTARTTREFTLWETVFSRYKEYLLAAGRKGLLKEKTVYDYQSRVKNFEQFLDETDTHLIYIYEFDRSLCVEFLDYLYFDKDVSAVTRNGYRTWLSTFSSWLIDKEYIAKDNNPVADIRQMREEEKKREPLTKPALKAMRDYLTSQNPHFLLACYIEYYVNIRPDEMRYLKIGYIDIANCIVTLPGKFAKNRKRQEVTVPKKVLKLMIDLGTFSSPSQYYIFGPDLRPST
jgi:site-specific recombinase XerC